MGSVRDFDLFVARRTPADLAAIAHEKSCWFIMAGLYIRVRGSGIIARDSHGPFSFPPLLQGRLEASSEGTRIVGRLHWRMARMVRLVFGFATILMVTGAVVVSPDDGPSTALFVLCVVAAVIFALIFLADLALGAVTRAGDSAGLASALRRTFEQAD